MGISYLKLQLLKNARYNENDAYYDSIMKWEGKKKKIGLRKKLNIKSWQSIFKYLQLIEKPIIVECEHPKIDEFIIGPIKEITKKSVSIQYFNAKGILDTKPTKIKYKKISKVTFGDRYSTIFGKYLSNNK